MKLNICKRCKKIILVNDICPECLNKTDIVNIDPNDLEVNVIEYTKSNINNQLFALAELKFDGMSIRVLGKIDKPSNRYKIKEFNDKIEFSAI
jgi:RNA polymerase subunit RPABC4/transcription elongation factor Spt4